jgi:hypothetical protein
MQTIRDVLPLYNLASMMIEQAKEDIDNNENAEDAKIFLDSDFAKQLRKEMIDFENKVENAWDKYQVED